MVISILFCSPKKYGSQNGSRLLILREPFSVYGSFGSRAPVFSYSLLLQKKAVRVVNFKYYKLYINKLPPYFENFILDYGAYHQNLRNNHTRLPTIRCYFEKKYQMHFRLHELASPSNSPLYPNIKINDDILSHAVSVLFRKIRTI